MSSNFKWCPANFSRGSEIEHDVIFSRSCAVKSQKTMKIIRDAGRAEGAEKKLRAMQTYEKQKK